MSIDFKISTKEMKAEKARFDEAHLNELITLDDRYLLEQIQVLPRCAFEEFDFIEKCNLVWIGDLLYFSFEDGELEEWDWDTLQECKWHLWNLGVFLDGHDAFLEEMHEINPDECFSFEFFKDFKDKADRVGRFPLDEE